MEALAAARIEGIKAKIYYTAYQGNIFGLAVPADSPIHKIADLKGKTISLIAMGGPGAQTAAMVRSRQDALRQFDAQYALVENAGVKLRLLDTRAIDSYPSNGFLALEETLSKHRREAVGLARAYAKGTILTIANPDAAVRIFYEAFPEAKPTGKDEATAVRDATKVLHVRIPKWKLEKGGVKRWGESSETNYAAYADLLKLGGIKKNVEVKDLITNELIAEINNLDPSKIAAQAKAYKPR